MAPEAPDGRTKTRSYPGRARSHRTASVGKGSGKSRFPAVARFWGRVNTGGDFEPASASSVFPSRPPWRLPVAGLIAGLKWLLPYLGSALVGALTALAVDGARTATRPSVAPPATVAAAIPATVPPITNATPALTVPLPASLAPSARAVASESQAIPPRPRARPASAAAKRRPPSTGEDRARAVPLDDGVLEPSFR